MVVVFVVIVVLKLLSWWAFVWCEENRRSRDKNRVGNRKPILLGFGLYSEEVSVEEKGPRVQKKLSETMPFIMLNLIVSVTKRESENKVF